MEGIDLEEMMIDELECRLRQAEKVSLGVAQEIDDDDLSRLNEKLAFRGIEIVREGGYVYAKSVDNEHTNQP